MNESGKPKKEMNIFQDDSFSFDGYQVVRGEFFAHIHEPSLTFSNSKVYVNMACIKKLPQFDYVQILVNPEAYKLAVRPCNESEKDSFRWCTATEKRTPKHITCRIFFNKVFNLMNWNPDNRYKILGKLIQSKTELLFVFDLTSAGTYPKKQILPEGKTKTSAKPDYPAEWKNQFGVTVAEHDKNVSINIFNEQTVFGLQEEPRRQRLAKQTSPTIESEMSNSEKSEITTIPALPNNRPEKESDENK